MALDIRTANRFITSAGDRVLCVQIPICLEHDAEFFKPLQVQTRQHIWTSRQSHIKLIQLHIPDFLDLEWRIIFMHIAASRIFAFLYDI